MTSYIVIGSGVSGISASRMLLKRGERVLLYDGNKKLDAASVKARVMEGFDSCRGRLDVHIGTITKELLKGIDVCVISPGVSINAPVLGIIKENNIEITGEVELAYGFARGKLAAITGTNGKTTTTALAGAILKAYFDETYIVGNIGMPYTSWASDMTDNAHTVIEISSFMMETAKKFHPDVSAILNITPDHLDRHGSMECYIEMKEKIAQNQTENDTCILNYSDPVLREFGERLLAEKRCRVVYFSSKSELENGYYVKDEVFYKAVDGHSQRLMHTDEINLLGTHNFENVCAAMAVTECCGVPMEKIVETVKNFPSVEHRIEYVRTVNGVKFYNDSKGTNIDAAIRAVKAMKGKTVLIGGGYDKNSSFEEWIESFDGRIKKLVLIGQTRERIARCCDKLGFKDYEYADSFEAAFKKSVAAAEAGENVLLSPACASWDMFDNYEQRGNIFKDMVKAL